MSREEFEKLPEIAARIICGTYWNEYQQKYQTDLSNLSPTVCYLNGAWYAFQEQQKKIDALKAEIKRAVLSLRNEFNIWADDNEQFHAIEAQIEQLEELLK